jgi:membrane protease YdiL (CAAX protease family)
VGGYFLPAIFIHRSRRGPALTHSVHGLLFVSAIDLALFLILYLLAARISRATFSQLFLQWSPGWWVVPLGAVYSVAIRLVAVGIVIVIAFGLLVTHAATPAQISSLTRHPPDFDVLVDSQAMHPGNAYYWLTITLISFVSAGLREELWRGGTLAALRELFPRAFSSRRGQMLAVVLIAIVFGAGHISMGLYAAIIAGLFGLMLGLVIVWHQSIWPAVFAHGFIDATSFALMPFVIDRLRGL